MLFFSDFWRFLILFRSKRTDMLTKRSTNVDQNFKSSKTSSKLSLAQFIASKTAWDLLKQFIYSKKCYFLVIFGVFLTLLKSKRTYMLTKRSTSVDQNVKSDKVMSQLFVAIFIILRTHLVAQK